MHNELFIAISDVHISLKNLEVSLKVLRQALEKCKELDIPLVIAGDLNDTKAVMRSEWVEALIQLFSEYPFTKIYIIDGNHDLNNKAGSKSSLIFLNLLKNVDVFHYPTNIDFKGEIFYMVPYCNTTEAFREALNQAREKQIKNIICHQGFKGAFMGDYVVDDSSIDPEELSDFKIVLSGHYHRHQWPSSNIMYFGSPFTVNFGEAGHNKYIWSIGKVSNKITTTPIPTKVRKHIQTTLEPDYATKNIPEEFQNASPEDLVKIVMKGPKEFALSKPLYKHPNLTLVPDIVKQSKIRIDQSIIDSPVQVIDEYLKNVNTEYDKKELKQFLWKEIGDVLNNLHNKVRKNIKVSSAIGENFLSYKNINYNYESKGLTLIEGHDEDYDISTGAGKSSFLDLVCYGLFGKTSKKLKADEVINRQEGKNLFVGTNLITESGSLCVFRYRKHKEKENDLYYTLNGVEHRGKDNLETQSMLESELNLDLEMFLISSYFSQFGDVDGFLSAPDSDKKKLISKICDTSIYDEIVEKIKESHKLYKESLLIQEKIVIKFDSEVGILESNVKDYMDKHTDFKLSVKNNLERLEKEKQEWENLYDESLTLLYSYKDDWENKRNERILSQLKKIKDWEDQEKESIESIKQGIVSKEKRIEEYKTQIEEVPDLNLLEQQKQDVLSKLDIVSKLEEQAGKNYIEIDVIKSKIHDVQKRLFNLTSASEKSTCNTCYQEISGEHVEKQKAIFQDQIESFEKDLKFIEDKNKEIISSTEIKPKLKEELKNIENKMFSIKQIESKNNSILQMIGQIKEEIEKSNSNILNRQANPLLGSEKPIKNEVNPFIQQIDDKKNTNNPFIEKIEAEKEKQSPYLDMFHEASEKLNSKKSQLVKLNEELEQTQTNIDYCVWWKDAVHIYIKSYLTDSFVEEINTLANETLSQMFDGILSIEISSTTENKKASKEKISVTIYNKNEECSYNSLSGGERCRICFALNLAIRKVTNINIGFIMFDEILNGLDDVGKSQVMRVLKELESEYESVFVIDHTTEFKTLFTNSIMVKKTNGISYIVE